MADIERMAALCMKDLDDEDMGDDDLEDDEDLLVTQTVFVPFPPTAEAILEVS